MWVILVFFIIVCVVLLAILKLPKIEKYYDNDKPNLVLITSVIYTHSSNLSYGVRSVLTPQQRFDQTLGTITSIKKYVPRPYIIVIEGSNISEKEQNAMKKAGCDEIINCADELAEFINGPHKSIAEIKMLLFGLKDIDPSKYSTISKISGRYYLTNNFKWNRYPLNSPLYQCETDSRCNTRYYRIPAEYFWIYKKTLEEALADAGVAGGRTDIEGYNIFRNFPNGVKLMKDKDPLLGVRGYIAPFGTEVEDFVQ